MTRGQFQLCITAGGERGEGGAGGRDGVPRSRLRAGSIRIVDVCMAGVRYVGGRGCEDGGGCEGGGGCEVGSRR